jgi:hypothetical protein
MSDDVVTSRSLFWFIKDAAFWANFTNVLLSISYACVDYGRGFLLQDVLLLDVLFILFAFGYVANGALYIALHAGEMPWPSGWTMLGEWLSLAGSISFAVTSIMYLDKSGTYTLHVLIIEALAAIFFAASSVFAAAGWRLEMPLKAAGEKRAKRTVFERVMRHLNDPYMWGYATNFIPAMVYIASNLTATELYYARQGSDVQDADVPQFSGLLRQLSRVYWYGDLIWLVNSVQWLVLYFIDSSDVALHNDGGDGGSGDMKNNHASPMMNDPIGSLRDETSGQSRVSPHRGGLQIRLLDEDFNGGLIAIPQPIIVRPRLRRRQERRWHIKDTTPYPIFGSCIRSWDSLFGPQIFHQSAATNAAAPPFHSRIDSSPSLHTRDTTTQYASVPTENNGNGGTIVGRVSSGRVLRLAVSMAAVTTPVNSQREVEMHSMTRSGHE